MKTSGAVFPGSDFTVNHKYSAAPAVNAKFILGIYWPSRDNSNYHSYQID